MLRRPDSIPATDTVIEDPAMELSLLQTQLVVDIQFMRE